MIKYRLFNPNVSMLHRAMQLTNAFIEYVLSSQLNLVHIVEYPKCGGSWIRNMIRTYRNTDLFLNNRLLRKNDVLMSHCLYTRRIKKPIIVVRDPRDIMFPFIITKFLIIIETPVHHYFNIFSIIQKYLLRQISMSI